MITSGGLGTMGFGFPAAIGAKIAQPFKNVVCLTGDGGFQMNGQELATACIEQVPVVICVFNNRNLGMVRQMQQLFYGKRYELTCLNRRRGCPVNCKGPGEQCPPYAPDFVKLAESYGAIGIRVTEPDQVEKALMDATIDRGCPVVIEFEISPDELVLPVVKSGNAMSEMILK